MNASVACVGCGTPSSTWAGQLRLAVTDESESQPREQTNEIKLDHTPYLLTRPQSVVQCSYLSKNLHRSPVIISKERVVSFKV